MADKDPAQAGRDAGDAVKRVLNKIAHADDINNLRIGRMGDDRAVAHGSPDAGGFWNRGWHQDLAQKAVDNLRKAGMTPDQQMHTHLDDHGLYPKIKR